MSNYLVLGGNGFLGKNICRFLVEHNEYVTSFDLKKPKNIINHVKYIEGDFFCDEDIYNALVDNDIIIHAISTINPGNSNENYMRGYSYDLIQTIKLSTWIAKQEKKLVFLSSGGTVYGEKKELPINEEQSLCPINHYGNVKACIEGALRVLKIQNNLDVKIVRISNPYGPGQDYEKGVGFIDSVLKKSLVNEPIEIWGDGSCVRDYIYVDDVCEMIYQIINNNNEWIFNICSGEAKSQNDIINILNKMGIKPIVIYRKARKVDLRKVVLDNSKIRREIGYLPRTIEEGIGVYWEYLSRKLK